MERAMADWENPSNKNAKTLRIGIIPRVVCGASRVRTGDPLLAKQMRYQLRYSPVGEKSGYAASLPSTWAREDLNLRPHPYQGCALTS